MKPSLQLKLSQHLTLTPQLQQSIRLLQLSTLELNQELEKFLQENPLLERDDDDDSAGGSSGAPGEGQPESAAEASAGGDSPSDSGGAPDSTMDDFDESRPELPEAAGSAAASAEADRPEEPDWTDEGSYGGSQPPEGEDGDYPQTAAGAPNLREHLLWQLNMVPLPFHDKQLAGAIVDSLDDDGYLKTDLAELAAALPADLQADADDLLVALRHVQQLEPAGVGARSLAECLELQLRAMPVETQYRSLALTVVRDHLDALAARDFARLKRVLKCDQDTLREVQRVITGLDPRPGSRFSRDEARYVVADVIVRKVKGMWLASLNPDAMPRLRVNRLYADILSRNRDASHQQLSSQLQEAKWLIKNVQQRFDTILRVSQCIVDRQRHFFEHGEVAMRPLVLREIADLLGLHESTISRVTTQKFMLTPRGIFELKYFFGSHVATDTGGACSATAIRALIKQMVGEEDSHRPLSDSQISEILGKQGIVVARRTIAKYRESLQILPVNLRKAI